MNMHLQNGTENENSDESSYNRGYNTAINDIKQILEKVMCEDYCELCEGMSMAIDIINDEFILLDNQERCNHTKYEGCQPCKHDKMISIMNSLGE